MEYPKIILSDSAKIAVSKTQLMKISLSAISVRNEGVLANKAVYLPREINGMRVDNWIIVEDNMNCLCAVPMLDK